MMRLSEQDIINAICAHIAERKLIQPTDVNVQLMYDEDLGFSAEVTAQGRSQILIEANMLEAIERFLLRENQMRVFRDQIELDIEEEMFALVQV